MTPWKPDNHTPPAATSSRVIAVAAYTSRPPMLAPVCFPRQKQNVPARYARGSITRFEKRYTSIERLPACQPSIEGTHRQRQKPKRPPRHASDGTEIEKKV